MTLYLDGKRIPERLDDDIEHIYGDGNDVRVVWETADADAHYLNVVVGASRNIIISEDRNIDWGLATSTNPQLVIQSADSASPLQRIAFSHNQTNAVINSGAGNLVLSTTAGNDVLMGDNVTILYVDGGVNGGVGGVGVGQVAASGVMLSAGWDAYTMGAGTTAARHMQIQGNVTELAGAAITDIVGAYFNTFTITDGGGAETVAQVSNVYIVGAPTVGTTPTSGPYSLFVDAGAVRVDDHIQWGAGVAVTAGNYSVGRDADGTNQLHFNVPTGATLEFSIQDVAKLVLGTTVWTLTGDDGSAANLQINNNGAGAGSFSRLTLQVGDSSMDSQVNFTINGGKQWALGADGSDRRAIVLSRNSALGTLNVIRFEEPDTALTNTTSSQTCLISPSLVEGTAGTHPILAGLRVNALSVTNDVGAATTDASTFYVVGTVTGITPTNRAMALWIGSGVSAFGGDVTPFTSDGSALGTATYQWADLFIASGGVINFNAGDVTMTHSANTLAFAGASSGYTFDSSINSPTATNTSVTLQSQTFTASASHQAVTITPTWTAENQIHDALWIAPTQNGANSSVLEGIVITMTKATGATVLATMNGITVDSPGVAGTVTASNVMSIANQGTAGITTPRGINFLSTGVANSIVWGGSALQYASAAENIRLADSTNANGLNFNLASTAIQTIRTVSATTGSLRLQTNTFTAGAVHLAVVIDPTWAAENFAHYALNINPTQNGANSSLLVGAYVTMNKATGASILNTMTGIIIDSPGVVGTVTSSFAMTIGDQGTAGITTARGIQFDTTGVANSIVWGSSALQYANAANNVRFMDATNARGIDLTLTAAGVQTIGTTAGNLTLSPTSANVATAANVDVDMSAGGRLYGGGVQVNSQTLAANTNLTMDENDGHIDITTGAVSNNTITLPAASGNQGMIVSFYLEVDGGFDAVITRAGADVIQNGSADLANTQVTLNDAGDYLMIQCVSATMWQVVVNNGGTVA